jgi:hypothetical protein
MLEPISVVVCARNAVCEAPDVGARDQYIPEAGAGATSGAVLGSGRGGKDVWGPLTVFATGVAGFGAVADADEEGVVGLLAMADVERKATGRGWASLLGV